MIPAKRPFTADLVETVVGPLKAFVRRLFRRGTGALEIQDRPAVEERFEPPDLSSLRQTVTGTTGASGMAGHALFLYNFVVNLRARWVIAFGVGPGDSNSAFLLTLSRTDERLVSIDIVRQPVAAAKVERLGPQDRWGLPLEGSEVARWEGGVQFPFCNGLFVTLVGDALGGR